MNTARVLLNNFFSIISQYIFSHFAFLKHQPPIIDIYIRSRINRFHSRSLTRGPAASVVRHVVEIKKGGGVRIEREIEDIVEFNLNEKRTISPSRSARRYLSSLSSRAIMVGPVVDSYYSLQRRCGTFRRISAAISLLFHAAVVAVNVTAK